MANFGLMKQWPVLGLTAQIVPGARQEDQVSAAKFTVAVVMS